MVDGVLLLVDAFEGCMPQTRFVLRKSLELNKIPILVVNKVDRQGARPAEVVDQALELFIELGATAEQLDFPVVYASARDNMSGHAPDTMENNMIALFDTIISAIPAPKFQPDEPLQILFSSIDYDDYVGRIGVGRIERGTAKKGMPVVICGGEDNRKVDTKITRLYRYEGLKRVEVDEAPCGDIICVAGMEFLNVGETVCDPACIEPLPFVHIDEPTVSMMFMLNDSPFAGREGKYVTGRNLRDRLFNEVKTNISMRVEETEATDSFRVSGRGELHLSILIETMRRQGYEFAVSRPKVIFHRDDAGNVLEPIEELTIDVPVDYVGAVMEKLGQRKAELQDMTNQGDNSVRLQFLVPARGLMGYRSELLTDTRGNGVMSHIFHEYEAYRGPIEERKTGSLVAHETGDTSSYGLFNTQDRGKLFVGSGVPVYEGQVVGENARAGDIVVNVCKKKHVTNMRASGSDDALRLTPPIVLSLEQCLEFIADDELVEVTPKSIRMRKRYLNKDTRSKFAKQIETE
jgi:GTP-binding protein